MELAAAGDADHDGSILHDRETCIGEGDGGQRVRHANGAGDVERTEHLNDFAEFNGAIRDDDLLHPACIGHSTDPGACRVGLVDHLSRRECEQIVVTLAEFQRRIGDLRDRLTPRSGRLAGIGAFDDNVADLDDGV